MAGLNREIGRFLAVGVTAVLIDLAFYRLGLYLGVAPAMAKGCSFVIGAVFAFFANRLWTFASDSRFFHPREVPLFAAVYLASLAANVLVNGLFLHILATVPWATEGAFLVATGTSTAMNFLGMKFLVFRVRSAG